MLSRPGSLRRVEERVRELLGGVWRPSFADGPSRDELVDRINAFNYKDPMHRL
jgi:hypothetical protein